jgi:hypothetical protein
LGSVKRPYVQLSSPGRQKGCRVGCRGMGGWNDGWRNGWIGGRKDGYKGVYRFSSLMKQNKKAKIYAVFCFAGFFFKKKYVMK